MGDLERIEEKVDWLVAAVRALLMTQAVEMGGITYEEAATVLRSSVDATVAGTVGALPDDDEDPEVAEMLAQPDPPPPIGCPASPTGTHGAQKLEHGNLVCANCGALLVAGTGMKTNGQRAQWLAMREGG